MIREFADADLKQVNKLLSIFNYSVNLNNRNDFFNVIVYEKNDIIGVLIYDKIYDRVEIEYIAVDQNYRKHGIATSMLEYVENKYDDIENITLEVRCSNESAIKFYLKNGFNKVTVRKNYYDNEDGILMIKKLGE